MKITTTISTTSKTIITAPITSKIGCSFPAGGAAGFAAGAGGAAGIGGGAYIPGCGIPPGAAIPPAGGG